MTKREQIRAQLWDQLGNHMIYQMRDFLKKFASNDPKVWDQLLKSLYYPLYAQHGDIPCHWLKDRNYD